MFVFEFEKPLFEFVYERPHCEPLLALPPTFSSSTVYCLSDLVTGLRVLAAVTVRSTMTAGHALVSIFILRGEEAVQDSVIQSF